MMSPIETNIYIIMIMSNLLSTNVAISTHHCISICIDANIELIIYVCNIIILIVVYTLQRVPNGHIHVFMLYFTQCDAIIIPVLSNCCWE